MKSKPYQPSTIKEAIDDLQDFLESDLYSKFRPEHKIKGKKWYRQDVLKNEKEFWEYLDAHFNILRKQIKRINNNQDVCSKCKKHKVRCFAEAMKYNIGNRCECKSKQIKRIKRNEKQK